MEIWDAYDSSFKIVKNKYLKRGELIPKGLYHLVCEVIVQHTDGTYLLMQRDSNKSKGGMWEASAAGSALKGEDAKITAKRELFEETGIIANNLEEKYKYIVPKIQCICVEFFLKTSWEKNKITLQKGETQDFKWVNAREIIKIKEKGMLTKTNYKIIMDIQDTLNCFK